MAQRHRGTEGVAQRHRGTEGATQRHRGTEGATQGKMSMRPDSLLCSRLVCYGVICGS